MQKSVSTILAALLVARSVMAGRLLRSLLALTVLILGPRVSASLLAADPPPAGRGLVTLSVQVDESSYGTSRYTESSTYDTSGNLLVLVRENDFDNDGTLESRDTTIHAYDHRSNLLNSVREAFNSDGTVGWRETITNTYDRRGNLLRSVTLTESDRNADGTVDARSSFAFTNTLDAEGNILTVVSEGDYDGDGVFESQYLVTHTYGHHGERLTSVYPEGSSTYTYDPRGRVLTIVEDVDFEDDGIVEMHSTYTNTYDQQGNLILNLLETDYNTSGTIDHYRELKTNTYDSRRNVLTTLIEYDYGGDGTIDYGRSESNTYDAHRNVLTMVVDSTDANGSVTDRQLWTFTYDVTGNLISRVADVDWDGDGVFDLLSTTTYSY